LHIASKEKFQTNELVSGLTEIYGNKLVKVILYGSVARGMHDDDSDIDIALILKSCDDASAYDRMLDLVTDIELEYDKVLSIVDIDNNKFTEWENHMPFYKNIKKDGIVL